MNESILSYGFVASELNYMHQTFNHVHMFVDVCPLV